jgi:hypothetical protein
MAKIVVVGAGGRRGAALAARVFGGANAPTLTGLSSEFLPASVHCSLVYMRTVGDECFLTYRIKRQQRVRRN